MRRAAPFLVIALILALPALNAVGALTPLNDLLALGQGIGQKPAKVAIATRAEPPFVATPRAQCGPGSKPEPREPMDPLKALVRGAGSLHCNVSLIAHQGASGGFKTLRYVDPAGHECAFYDTALLFPVNALKLDTSSAGVAVLDMSNPAKPVQTASWIGTDAVVTAGLNEGDTIIVDNLIKVRPGAPVSPHAPGEAPQAPPAAAGKEAQKGK